MNKKMSVIVPEGSFRSKLIPVAAVLSALAAVAGVLSALILFTPGAINYLDVTGGTYSAKLTWTVIHIMVLVFFTVWSALSAVALLSAKFDKIGEGMDLFSHGTRILRGALGFIGIAMLVLFVVRAVLYSIACLTSDVDAGYGLIFLFSALLGEIVLAGIAAAIIILLRRFLDTIGDSAASVTRTITSGVLKGSSIPMASAIGCMVVGIGSLILGAGRMSAAAVWAAEGVPSLYTFMLYAAAALFFLSGAANTLMFLYLRKFKQTSEYLLFKGTPVEEETAPAEEN